MRALLRVSLLLVASACGGGETPPATSPTSTTDPSPKAGSTTPKGPDHPESDKVTWKKDGGKSCHVKSKTSGDLVAATTSIAQACIDTTKMHQVGTATTGQGDSANAATIVKSIPLKAQANHCYRVIGLAEDAVTDFDIAVIDSAGKSAGEDLTDTNDSIVLEDGSICFKSDDNANVNAAVAAGAGKWAVEIWSD